MKRFLLLAVLSSFVLLLLSGCNVKQSASSDNSLNLFPKENSGKAVASFDGITVTDKYVKSYLDQLNPYLKSRYSAPEKKKELITRIAEGELLAHYALKKGVANDPVLLTKIKSNIARFYMASVMKNKIEKNIKVTPEEIKAYFEKNKKKYTQPAKVKASHILIKIDEKRNEAAAKKLAEKVYKQVLATKNQPNSFAKLVQKYSEDTGSKRRNGDVGYFARVEEGGRMVKEFTDAAFALKKIGDISPLVKTQYGFHIIKLTGKKDAVEKTLHDVSRRIESTLKAEKRKEAYNKEMENIKKETGFTLDESVIRSINMDIPDDVKSGMGNGMLRNNRGKIKLSNQQIQQMKEAIRRMPKANKGKGQGKTSAVPKASEK